MSSRARCLLGGAANAAGPARRRTRPSTVPSSAFCCSCRRCAASSSSALPSFLRRALWCGSARRRHAALGPASPGRRHHSRLSGGTGPGHSPARAGAQLDAAEEQVGHGGRRPGPLGGRRGQRRGLRRWLLPRLPARQARGALRCPPSRHRQAAERARRAAPRAGGLAPPLPRGLHLRRLAVRARRCCLIGVPAVPQRLCRARRRRGPRAGAQRGEAGGARTSSRLCRRCRSSSTGGGAPAHRQSACDCTAPARHPKWAARNAPHRCAAAAWARRAPRPRLPARAAGPARSAAPRRGPAARACAACRPRAGAPSRPRARPAAAGRASGAPGQASMRGRLSGRPARATFFMYLRLAGASSRSM